MPLKKTRKGIIVVFIVGPTAIGKTNLSIRLAKRINSEIISADSMQVYKGMRILSQPPSPRARKGVRHHLVGLLDPKGEYSAASFMRRAARIIDSIAGRNKIPIIVGGSGLYVKALADGLFPSPKADLGFRKRMHDLASRCGSGKLHERLSEIDPAAARTIHPNDLRRIIRALEIYASTGRTMTELKRNTKGLKDRYIIKIFGLKRRREKIYSNIDLRTDRMFDEGIVREVKRFKGRKISKTAKAILGFKEVMGYINGEYDLAQARSLLKRNTRRFAKRQLTWFKADKRIRWFDLDKFSVPAVVDKIAKEVA